MVEKTFWNVNIAHVNEMALIFEWIDIAIWEMADAAATKSTASCHSMSAHVSAATVPPRPLLYIQKSEEVHLHPPLDRDLRGDKRVNENARHQLHPTCPSAGR